MSLCLSLRHRSPDPGAGVYGGVHGPGPPHPRAVLSEAVLSTQGARVTGRGGGSLF